MTATYDEKKHPRHPKGTAEGGEFRRVTALPTLQEAATRERERNLENLPKGFPRGAFAPEDSVKFWPLRMGGFNAVVPTGPHGPFWKAITDPHTGDELAFWFVDAAGYPHHTSMAQALGLRTNFVPISGYGTVSDAAAFPDGSPSSERAHEIPERHRRDLRDANAMLPENQQDRALAAAAWDESKHPREPSGSDKGGEFAPALKVGMLHYPKTPGLFEPNAKVQFWPKEFGTYQGEPIWKGLTNRDGKEIAFWFVDDFGNPHHQHMAAALGIHEAGTNRLVGNGYEPDVSWLRGRDELIDQARAMAERHRRDIRDARQMVAGEQERALAAASVNLESDELMQATAKLQRQYEKVYRRAAKRAVAAYRDANKVLTAAVTPQPDEIVNPVAILESFMRLTGLARRGLLLEILNTLRTAYGMEQVDQADEQQPDEALSIYLDLLQEQAGVQAERLVAGAQDAAASVMLESLAEGWSVPQTAKALKAKMESIAPWQATMLARTDLIALGNGASVQRAVVLNDPQLQYKTWLATPDERTRLNHRHAHGQTVPVNQAFTVAGEQLQYPGDPSASDGNVINCRCTVVYGADPLGPEGVRQIAMLPDLAVSAAAWDESKHHREPAGSEKGGEFARDVRGGRLQAEIERQRAAQGRNPSGFPPGEFAPDDPKVKFWPNQMGGYKYADRPGAPSGPFWKALYDPRSDTELAFWFVDKHGLPNHAPMQRALGQIPSDRTWFTYSGYGMVGDSMRRGRPQRSTIEEDIVNRHRRDIRDANAMLPESQQDRALAAAAWDETKHPREPGGTREGGRFADKGTPGDVYYGARMVVEDGKSVGYQAFRMQRMISQHKGVRLPGIRTDAGPVRETYEEARDDAIAARDAPSAPPLAAAASANAVLEMQRTRARERATGARLFDEAKHPRHPKGTPEGGEFREKGSIAAQPTVDETRARQDFEAWAAGVEPYYEDKQQFADAKNWLWGRYEESVGRSLPALRSRLEKAGVPGVTIFPQGDKGDWDVLADPEATHSADYQVQLPSDGDALPPDFTVWTYEDGTVEVEDVLDIGDKDFFPNGPESPTAQNYAKLVDAARGLPLEGQDESFVTIYRGMSDKEFNSWENGDPIPAGKFFTDQPTVQYAQDIPGEPPNLRAFRVPRSMVVQTGTNEYQLRQTGAMKSGRIEPATQFQPPFRSGRQWRAPVSASGVAYTGNGGMIALYPEPDEAEVIARENGQDPEDLHVTLLFYPDGVPGHAAAVIKDMGYEGIKGQITGVGRFKAGEDGVPVVGLVSAVGLNELRAKLAERLPGYSEKFGFVPHLTLGYENGNGSVKDAEGATGLPVTFRAVTVKDGNDREDVVTAAGWDEAKHPREPSGTEKGGQFAPALQLYTANSFDLNAALRGQRPFTAYQQETVRELDKLIDEQGENSNDDNMTVYRGVPINWEPQHYTEPGYLSTTESEEEAGYFTGTDGEVLEIKVPEGMRFYRVPPGAYDLGYDQKEVIFPRGTELRRERDGTYTAITHEWSKPQLPAVTAAGWDESAHPRWPAGSERGGEFAPKGTLATEAVIGPTAQGGYRIPATGNLKQHLIKVAELEMGDILGSWPELSAEQAERLKAFIEREYNDGLLASNRTPGSARREARWVMKEFGEPEFGARAKKAAPPAPVETLPPTGNVRSVLDKLAIGGGRNSDLVLDAVRTIDQTMHYPKVAGEQELKIKMTSGRGSRQAALWRSQSTMEPQKITVSSNGQNVISSSVHEMGHYLDSLLGQDRRPYEGPALYWEDYSSKQHDGTLRPVIAAIKETDMYQRLARAESGAFGRNTAGVFEYGGRRFAAGQKHIRYLMQPPELLARSFEQYIAQKNPKSRLAGTMRHAFNVGGQAFLMPPEYPGYMQGQDLVNVNNAWERVLRERGLLKKQGFEEPPPPKTEAAVREAARRKALDATVRDLATPAPRPISEEERRRREVMGEIARILK